MKDDNVCSSTSAMANLRVNSSPPQANAGLDIITCNPSVSLNANTGGTWSVAAGTGSFSNTNDSVASVTGFSSGINKFVWTIAGLCGRTTDTVIVNTAASNLILIANASFPDTSCVGTERTLSASLSGGSGVYTYHWSSVDGSFNSTDTIASVVVAPPIITEYIVYAVDNIQLGCTSNKDTVRVVVIPSQDLYIPNLLTPNGDGKNDQLIIKDINGGALMDGSIVEVYNRYGEAVFKSKNYKNDFNPSDLSNGVYYLYIKAGCGKKESKTWLHVLGKEHD